jgi:EpsI family protein
MRNRRELLIGGACLGGAALAYGLRPRRRISLLGRAKLADLIPAKFGDWSSRDVSDLVAPATDGSLLSQLYGETVERVYRQEGGKQEVMMMLAYGADQSNDLQLHRPEVCYPAFGYRISRSQADTVAITPQVGIPCRRLVADAQDRRENVVYWTRFGEFMPVSVHEQHFDRLKMAMRGVVSDGLLVRFSVIESDSAASFSTMDGFIPQLVQSIGVGSRSAVIGTERARALAAVHA